jgi:predicted alpha-1,2-mannosidase
MSTNPSLDPNVYSSAFKHEKEKVSAGCYEVFLDDEKIKAELTATLRTGIHRYTYPAGKPATLIIDLLHRDKTLDCDLRIIDSVTIAGYRVSSAWAQEQRLYFVIRFSQPFKYKLSTGRNPVADPKDLTKGADGAVITFNNLKSQQVIAKVAISGVSTEGAMKNLLKEAGSWDFNQYKKSAFDTWNRQLQKIEISETDNTKKTIFYTALYHCFIHPSLNMDVDSLYRGRDKAVHKAKNFTNYSVFSLWDTYRSLHPLLTVLEQGRTSDFVNSMLVQYQQGGRLPVWELSGNETNCMIGYHAASVIADAFVKGIKKYDINLAYEAVLATSTFSGFGIPQFNRKGFLEVDDEHESVSKTLEYSYDSWCVAQLSHYTGNNDDKRIYLTRSLGYKNLFDPSTHFIRPRKNGGWLRDFKPAEINNHFTEGNSWQYSFYVPHDIDGLIELHGGRDNFEKKLDELFSTAEKNTGRQQADVTGLIGQYAHGNEPSHHLAYLYSYLGKTQKSIQLVDRICSEFYKNSPDGLIGNEDCGQMSAWYVWSCMGMYPICPGNPYYAVAAPRFSNMRIHLENGLIAQIAANRSSGNFLSALSINETPLNFPAVTHGSLEGGSNIGFGFSARDSQFGARGLEGFSAIGGISIIPAPTIESTRQVFADTLNIKFNPGKIVDYRISHTINGKVPVRSQPPAPRELKISETSTVQIRLFSGSDSSAITTARFYKLKYPFKVLLTHSMDPQYSADGPSSLIDGIPADTDWRKGNWLGIQGKDFECIVDLTAKKTVTEVGLTCLQDTRSWILMPAFVDFLVSSDGKTYRLAGTARNDVKPDDYTVQIKDFKVQLQGSSDVRYVKIQAHPFGTLPGWHEGKGGQAYIFAAELDIK